MDIVVKQTHLGEIKLQLVPKDLLIIVHFSRTGRALPYHHIAGVWRVKGKHGPPIKGASIEKFLDEQLPNLYKVE